MYRDASQPARRAGWKAAQRDWTEAAIVHVCHATHDLEYRYFDVYGALQPGQVPKHTLFRHFILSMYLNWLFLLHTLKQLLYFFFFNNHSKKPYYAYIRFQYGNCHCSFDLAVRTDSVVWFIIYDSLLLISSCTQSWLHIVTWHCAPAAIGLLI